MFTPTPVALSRYNHAQLEPSTNKYSSFNGGQASLLNIEIDIYCQVLSCEVLSYQTASALPLSSFFNLLHICFPYSCCFKLHHGRSIRFSKVPNRYATHEE